MILIIYAHPYPQHSHANKRMLEQAGTLEGVEIRSLYQLYPDFNIDVAAEQAALARADLVIWQHPMQWYSVPPLLKLWMDKVLSHGWAYGHNGIALRGDVYKRQGAIRSALWLKGKKNGLFDMRDVLDLNSL